MKSLMILVAGPYRSGTDDVPERMAENLRYLDRVGFESPAYFTKCFRERYGLTPRQVADQS